MFQRWIVEVLAAQPMPELLAANASPYGVHLLTSQLQQLLHRANSALMQPLLHPCANPRQIAWRQCAQSSMQQVGSQRDQPVGLFHVGGDLRQIAVRRQSDRAAQSRAGPVTDRLLDPPRKVERRKKRLLPSDQAAGHLV